MNKSRLGRAVFLDRDGVINKEAHHLHRLKDLRILSGVALAIRSLNKLGYRVIVVTNQPVIAHGLATHETVCGINAAIGKRLGRQGAVIDAIYYCPHHPEGKIKKYAIKCDCRKPAKGMIQKAAKDFCIDLKKSFLVGDKTSDILAGQRSGLTTILVKTGYGGSDKDYQVTPDFIAKDLLSATKHYIS